MDEILVTVLLIVLALWVLAVMIGLPVVAAWQGVRIARLARRLQQLEGAGRRRLERPPKDPLKPSLSSTMSTRCPPPLRRRPNPRFPRANARCVRRRRSRRGSAAGHWAGQPSSCCCSPWRSSSSRCSTTAGSAKWAEWRWACWRAWPCARGRLPLPAACLAGPGADVYRRRHRAAVPLHVRRLWLLPPGAAAARLGVPRGLGGRDRGPGSPVRGPRHCPDGRCRGAAHSLVAADRARPVPRSSATWHWSTPAWSGWACCWAWPAVGTVAVLGTQGIFWAWYGERFHPEKLAAAIGFQTGLFALYITYSTVTNVIVMRRAH